MRLKKEDVYIDLKGKSKKELTELYNFLESVGEKRVSNSLGAFLKSLKAWNWNYYVYDIKFGWTLSYKPSNTEVTIEQLKEIIKPNLQAQLENIKKEIERIEKLIMEENKPKVGDWCKFLDDDKSKICVSKLRYINHGAKHKYHTHESYYKNCKKITNPELIKLLEYESK